MPPNAYIGPKNNQPSSGFDVCSIIKYHSGVSHSTKMFFFFSLSSALLAKKIFLTEKKFFFFLEMSKDHKNIQRSLLLLNMELIEIPKYIFLCCDAAKTRTEN
jgi:hypothetical protein